MATATRKPPTRPDAGSAKRAREYESFYGLSESPFALTSDPKFLYHSESHDKAAQAVLDAIRRRDGIALLTGEMGMGKTLLCRAVMDQLDRRTLTSLVADPFVSPDDLLKTILSDFGVARPAERSAARPAAAAADMSAALRDFLYSLAPLQAFAVVIIDEAQSLSVPLLEQVRTLAETGGEEQLLQVILVGQPSLSGTLARPALRPLFHRVTSRIVLGPLAHDEISQYVEHRLRVASDDLQVRFNTAALNRLYELSRGAPRIVNLVCDHALAAGSQRSARTIDAGIVNAAAANLDLMPATRAARARHGLALAAGFTLLVLLGAAAGAYVFRDRVTALIDQWRTPQQAPPTLPVAVTPAPAAPANPPVSPDEATEKPLPQ